MIKMIAKNVQKAVNFHESEMDIVILFVMYKNVSMMEMIVYFTKKHNAV